jgi:hypothetical protein
MPRRLAMSTLVTRCQQRADKVGNDFILAAEWRSMISEVYGADVFSVVAATGGRYFETTATLTTTGAAYVDEPADHLTTVRVAYVDATGLHHELAELTVAEEGRLLGRAAGAWATHYTVVDDRLYLFPTPPTGQTYEVRYTPQATDLSDYADGDLVDLVTPDGEACLYWGVAVLARSKASQDVTLHVRKHDEHRMRLMEWAAERSMTEPRRRDVDHELPPGDWGYNR